VSGAVGACRGFACYAKLIERVLTAPRPTRVAGRVSFVDSSGLSVGQTLIRVAPSARLEQPERQYLAPPLSCDITA
jgi:hypothetical protein